MGHSGTATPLDTLLTLLKLYIPCLATLLQRCPLNLLGLWLPDLGSGPLQLPQTGVDVYLALLHLMALELHCSGRKGEGSGVEERENEPKLQFYSMLCSFKILKLKKISMIFSQFHIRKKSHSQAIHTSYLSILVRNFFKISFKEIFLMLVYGCLLLLIKKH